METSWQVWGIEEHNDVWTRGDQLFLKDLPAPNHQVLEYDIYLSGLAIVEFLNQNMAVV